MWRTPVRTNSLVSLTLGRFSKETGHPPQRWWEGLAEHRKVVWKSVWGVIRAPGSPFPAPPGLSGQPRSRASSFPVIEKAGEAEPEVLWSCQDLRKGVGGAPEIRGTIRKSPYWKKKLLSYLPKLSSQNPGSRGFTQPLPPPPTPDHHHWEERWLDSSECKKACPTVKIYKHWHLRIPYRRLGPLPDQSQWGLPKAGLAVWFLMPRS